jgi:hypothetical protein
VELGPVARAAGIQDLCGLLGAMMQNEQLIAGNGEQSVRPTVVVAELHLISAIMEFHNRANLPANQSMFRQVGKQGDYIE